MAALNVRNVTLEQMASWKAAALAEGKTLREWVLEQLGRKTVYPAVGVAEPADAPISKVGAERRKGSNPFPRTSQPTETKRCPECFAGLGMHQKGCSKR